MLLDRQEKPEEIAAFSLIAFSVSAPVHFWNSLTFGNGQAHLEKGVLSGFPASGRAEPKIECLPS